MHPVVTREGTPRDSAGRRRRGGANARSGRGFGGEARPFCRVPGRGGPRGALAATQATRRVLPLPASERLSDSPSKHGAGGPK